MGKVILNQFLIYNDLRQTAQRIYSASRPLQVGDPDVSIVGHIKVGVLKNISDFPSPK